MFLLSFSHSLFQCIVCSGWMFYGSFSMRSFSTFLVSSFSIFSIIILGFFFVRFVFIWCFFLPNSLAVGKHAEDTWIMCSSSFFLYYHYNVTNSFVCVAFIIEHIHRNNIGIPTIFNEFQTREREHVRTHLVMPNIGALVRLLVRSFACLSPLLNFLFQWLKALVS